MDGLTSVRRVWLVIQLCWLLQVLATDLRTKSSNSQKTTVVDQISSSQDFVYRPNYNKAEPVLIECDLHISSIDSVTEVNMDFTVEVILHLTWNDNRLAKKFESFNVDFVELGAQKMTNFWVPDIFFPNEKRAAFHNVMSHNKMIRLHRNQSVHFITRLSLTLSCPMNLRKYPFDQQRCSIKMESFGFTKRQLQLKWSNSSKPLLVKEGTELPQFQLIGHNYVNTESFSKIRGNYSSLRADFFMVRNINYYVIQMYIPSLLIVMLSWVSFWLNVNSVPGRVNLGVLSVLTISTQSSSVNRSLPRVSYTKAIDVWMAACLVFVVAALVEFAIANVLSRRGSGKGMMFIKKIIKLARDRNRSNEKKEDITKEIAKAEEAGSSVRQRENREEKDTVVGVDGSVQTLTNCQHFTIEDDDDAVKKKSPKKSGVVYAYYLDVASRVLFPVAFGVFNLVYWIYYLNVMNDIFE